MQRGRAYSDSDTLYLEMALVTLAPEEKAKRARQRMLDKAREYSLGTYSRQVARIFQRMIRAEYAATPDGDAPAIFKGELFCIRRRIGQCVCVTCGKVGPWTGSLNRYGGMHTGHFLGSRCNSLLFEEDNVAPQCSHCNYFRSGEQQLFRIWMLAVRGQKTVDRLERLKTETRQFTREQLVAMRIAFQARLKAAEERIGKFPITKGETT